MAIVFDFDGPIFDGYSASITVLERCMRDELGIRDFVFDPTKFSIPKKMLAVAVEQYSLNFQDDVEKSQLFKRVLLRYEKELIVEENERYLVPGIEKALSRLHTLHEPIFILSDRSDHSICSITKKLHLDPLFIEILGRDHFGLKPADGKGPLYLMQKYNFTPKQLILIGDTEVDKKTAEAAGIEFYLYVSRQTSNSLKSAISYDKTLFTPEELFLKCFPL